MVLYENTQTDRSIRNLFSNFLWRVEWKCLRHFSDFDKSVQQKYKYVGYARNKAQFPFDLTTQRRQVS